MIHLGYSAGMSLTINSLDLVAKASSILGFNIFLFDSGALREGSR